ncbi:malonyl-ACP O-methyltransferase BioC [Motiliproteus sp. SC1-56]|uniref:malonyl-ACP O-methyltransferase BioC n=1 Tax=Motiliproteus sp. SC1-56 TaxID=2799565 RepID=UPI001A8D2250|nr:malonyl-ACP O-methyltransferase BioC [Motiliproteus sp. SC1-56]
MTDAVQCAETAIDKRRVAASFSRAAASYDSVANLQRRVGHSLLERAPAVASGRVLDLGCGTGYFSRQLADAADNRQVVALDLAEGMLQYARRERPHSRIQWLCGDAEQIPLATGAVDGVFSSLAIQWCRQLPQLFQELARVLRPGGQVAIATLGPDTLWELREAWRQVDHYVHVNRFDQAASLRAALPQNLELEVFDEERIELGYRELRTLTGELKGLGAHNVNAGGMQGLSGRRRIQAFRAAYEGFRNDADLLPATYQVYYLVARRRP